MKRALSVLLLIAMLSLLFACGEEETLPVAATQEQQTETPEQTPEATTEADAADTPAAAAQTVAVLSDTDGVALTVTSIEAAETDGYTLTLSLTNETQSYQLAAVSAIVNGWVGDQRLLMRAEAESETSAQLYITKDFLDLCEIGEVAEILLPFSITNEDFEVLASGTGTIDPNGEEAAETIAAYQHASKKSDTVLLNDENAFAVVTKQTSDDPDGYAIRIYIQNKSDRAIKLQLSDTCMNNYVHPEAAYSSPSIPAGASLMVVREFDADAMELDGIRKVTKIDFNFTLEYDDSAGGELASGYKVIYPLGKDAVRNPLHVAVEGETALIDNAYYTVIVTDCDTASNPESYGIDLYLENNTSHDLDFCVENIEINGIRYWGTTLIARLPAGKRCNTSLAWNKEALGLSSETPVESITLPLIFYNMRQWKSGTQIYENTFTVQTW